MKTTPTKNNSFLKYNDQEVIIAWKWFLSYTTKKAWNKRKAAIEKKITTPFRKTGHYSDSVSDGTLLMDKDDKIGWYLYLVEMQIYYPYKFEYYQGSRIIPLFKRLGHDLDFVKKIKGIDRKIKNLIYKRPSEADAILFEILVAVLWSRNGYEVEFIPEKSDEKSPDILAKKGNSLFNIECKRQSKTSDYAYRETEKRQKMQSYLRESLIHNNILLDIVFHVELHSLPDTYLKDIIGKKLELGIRGKIISNNEVDITLNFVNMQKIHDHLKIYSVKHNSPMLSYLINGNTTPNRDFTCGVVGRFYRVGEGDINNLFVSDITNAFGITFKCDAKEAINAKARDIKSQINKAIKQFNSSETAVIHIGIETFDGPEVEKERFKKISNTIKNINPNDSSLRWIFCHFMQSYASYDDNWFFDETVSKMSAYDESTPSPLKNHFIIIPEDADIEDNLSHWDRPMP